jgi:internalin A
MVKARLLVVDGERVEIAHEALLRTWEPLSQWIDEWYVGLETSRTDKSVLKSLPAEKEAPCKQEITQSGKDVKIVLLGRGGAGKTSLLKRLKGEAFNPNEPMTQGIQLSKFPFQAMDDTFRLNVWDFAGQESMHATHQFFLTKNTIYLLVLQGREGGEDAEAEYWLSYLEAFGDDSPVLVVLNKINECSFDLNYNSLLSRYRQCRDFVKTDCKENNGIDKLSSHLQSLISGMPSAQFYLRPPYWPRVKSRLEQMGKVLVATEEIYTLCSEEGVSAQDEIEELLNIFHLLGIVLSYQDDAVLEGIVFLNPEWVANGIYAVLTSEFLAAKEGEIDMHDLRTVLSAQRFPLDTHQYVIRLMRKFGLCLPYYKDDIHLFPELLGKAEPDAAHGFEPVRCLNYEYHYGFLPHGLIPRFIVQSHILSCPQSRWRSGVVLTHLKCRALVIGDPTKRRVTVLVKNGQPSARRELLGIIRAYFKQVHFQFSRDRLDVQERVPLIGYPSVSVDPDKLSAFELKGIQTYPEYDGQIVFTVDVSELLNGIEPERRDHLSGRQSSRPKHIFISYSHKDERYRAQLETHLTHLKNLGIISFWHDRMILPSREWESEIDENLRNADIVIMLISPDFMASDYCMGKEVRYAMDRHHSSTAQILPILVRKCDYKDLAFGKIQGLPKNQRPVSSWKDKDSAWHDVCMGIRSVAEEKDAASER